MKGFECDRKEKRNKENHNDHNYHVVMFYVLILSLKLCYGGCIIIFVCLFFETESACSVTHCVDEVASNSQRYTASASASSETKCVNHCAGLFFKKSVRLFICLSTCLLCM